MLQILYGVHLIVWIEIWTASSALFAGQVKFVFVRLSMATISARLICAVLSCSLKAKFHYAIQLASQLTSWIA